MATQAQRPDFAEPKQQSQEQSQAQQTPLLDKIITENIAPARERLRFEEERFGFQQRRARLYAKSGLFAGGKDMSEDQAIAQAMVRIELGASMGFSEAESLQGIRVINGETSIAAALRAARMQAAGYSWVLEWYGTEEVPAGCRVWLSFKGKPVLEKDGKQVSVAFLETDAKKMLTTIWENNVKKRVSILEKDNWKMSPRNMYFARAITNTQRFYAPGVLSINLPSSEEAMDFDAPSPVPGDIRRGSHEEQERVAEEKLAAMGVDLNSTPANGTTAAGETAAQRDARIQRQIDEQTEAARVQKAAEQETSKGSDSANISTYSQIELPDAGDFATGTQCYLIGQDGTKKKLRVVEREDGPTWEDDPQPATATSARPKPVFGRKP